jgi:hypothetical protein
MKQIKLLAIFALLTCLQSVPALASDMWPVPDLVTSWAKGVHKEVKWEAGDQFNGMSVRLDQNPGVTTLADFERAFTDLNQIIETSQLGSVPLVACIFDDVVMIRRLDQPSCGKPLSTSE